MIRINLLPHKTVRKKKTPGLGAIAALAACGVAALIGNYMYLSNREDILKSHQATIAKQKKEIEELNRAIGKVKTFQEEKAKIEEQLNVLQELEQGRSGPVKMLDALSTAVPKNVWLGSLKEQNLDITLTAEAISNEDIAQFMKMLKETVWTPRGIGRVIPNLTEDAPPRVELLPSGEMREFEEKDIAHFFQNIELGRTSARSDNAGTVSFTLTFKVNYAI